MAEPENKRWDRELIPSSIMHKEPFQSPRLLKEVWPLLMVSIPYCLESRKPAMLIFQGQRGEAACGVLYFEGLNPSLTTLVSCWTEGEWSQSFILPVLKIGVMDRFQVQDCVSCGRKMELTIVLISKLWAPESISDLVPLAGAWEEWPFTGVSGQRT